MALKFEPMNAATAASFRAGNPDVYGNPAEHRVSDGDGIPCRRCMKMVPKGDAYLLVAWRPFTACHAYAETGPVFLCAAECAPDADVAGLPEFLDAPDYILRGYDAGERIVPGTGGVIARDEIESRAAALLERDDVVAVHVRSARNNCYHCRIVATATAGDVPETAA